MISIYFKHGLPDFSAEIDYAISFLENHPLLTGKIKFTEEKQESLLLTYGFSAKNSLNIPAQKLLFSRAKVDPKRLFANVFLQDTDLIYSVESEQREKPGSFFHSENFGFDIIEMLFFHLTRYEEYHATDREKDEWGMYVEEKQFLVRNDLVNTPVVDNLVVAFAKVLGLDIDKKSSYIMTHDIDVLLKQDGLWKFGRSLLAGIKNGRGLRYVIAQLKAYAYGSDPYDVYNELLLKEDFFEQKIIYFLAGGSTQYDRPYGLESTFFKKTVAMCRNRNYRFGLHPSYASAYNHDIYRQQKLDLEKSIATEVQLTRQHFLRFDFRTTVDILEKNKIVEDSSLGFQNRIGFRCGTGFSYKLWHFGERRATRFSTLPMVVMEVCMDRKSEKKELDTFLTENSHNTQITFNFHNSTFDQTTPEGKVWMKFYKALIMKLRKQID